MYFLLNLIYYVKSYGHLCQILAFFKMPAHQIWSCHVTHEANFEFFYFVLILHLILGKVTKFQVEKLSTSEVINQKPQGRWKTPGLALRVKAQNGSHLYEKYSVFPTVTIFFKSAFLCNLMQEIVFLSCKKLVYIKFVNFVFKEPVNDCIK